MLPYDDELPPPLGEFYRKVPHLLAGGHTRLSTLERAWLRAFRQVAREHRPRLTEDDSFALSLDALCRCYAKRAARSCRYVLRGCRNAHRDWLRGQKSGRRPVGEPSYREPWDDVDARLDLEWALAEMGRADAASARAVRLRWRGASRSDLARELGLCERQVARVLRLAAAWLRCVLGGAERKPTRPASTGTDQDEWAAP